LGKLEGVLQTDEEDVFLYDFRTRDARPKITFLADKASAMNAAPRMTPCSNNTSV
jgi:hypothetical protein